MGNKKEKLKLKISLLEDRYLKTISELERDIDYLLSYIENPGYCKSRVFEIKLGREFNKSYNKDMDMYILMGASLSISNKDDK